MHTAPPAETVDGAFLSRRLGRRRAYNACMRTLSSTQQKSLALAIVVTVLLAVAFLFGGNSGVRELFSDETLAANHLEDVEHDPDGPGTISDGLRHEVPVRMQEATVVRVVDGDTLVVSVGGTEQKVRLIGINAPESVASDPSRNTEEGSIAADYLKSAVQPGQTVFLQRDTSDTDDYGRLLRYVWLERPDAVAGLTDPETVRTSMLNAKILDEGYAVAHKYKPDDAYFELFKSYQLEALHAERGLWVRGVDWSQGI